MNRIPWIAAALSIAAWGAEVPQAAVVRFSTVCFNCHEGECSGRLSFDSGAQAAHNHVRRYLGVATTPAEIDTLFALLKYTKERCAHYPLAATVPADGRWDADVLARWRNSVEGGYFLPLGRLDAGDYRLDLRFSGEPQGRGRVTDARFDIAGEESFCRDRVPTLQFTSTGGEHYFHLQGAGILLRIEVSRQ
jgi:hypothetical protein